jgi:OOP family OmpA-OmpF porin
MKTKSLFLGAAAALVVAAPAEAAPNGWYLGIEGGANWAQDVDFVHTRNAGASSFHDHGNFDAGWAVLATVGFEWSQWRFEGEVGYRQNKMNRISATTGSVTTNVGNFDELTLMANVLYDIPLGSRFSLSLGGGVGADRSSFNWSGFGASGGLHQEDWRFAWQGIAGLNYALSGDWETFVDYRYLDVSGPSYSIPSNRFVFDNLDKQALTVGLRYHFTP